MGSLFTEQKLVSEAEELAYGTSHTSSAARGRGGGRGGGRGRGRGGKVNENNWWIEKRKKKQEEKNKTK